MQPFTLWGQFRVFNEPNMKVLRSMVEKLNFLENPQTTELWTTHPHHLPTACCRSQMHIDSFTPRSNGVDIFKRHEHRQAERGRICQEAATTPIEKRQRRIPARDINAATCELGSPPPPPPQTQSGAQRQEMREPCEPFPGQEIH